MVDTRLTFDLQRRLQQCCVRCKRIVHHICYPFWYQSCEFGHRQTASAIVFHSRSLVLFSHLHTRLYSASARTPTAFYTLLYIKCDHWQHRPCSRFTPHRAAPKQLVHTTSPPSTLQSSALLSDAIASTFFPGASRVMRGITLPHYHHAQHMFVTVPLQ